MLLSYGAKIWLRISLCYVITTCYFLILRCLASQSSTLGIALYVPIAMVPPLYFATEYIAIEPIAITERVTTPHTQKKVSSRDHSRLSLHVSVTNVTFGNLFSCMPLLISSPCCPFQ